MENNIKVSDLKKLINLIAFKLNDLDESSSFTIENDLYWNIQEQDLYNVYENPNELTIGSLIEDWIFLETIILEKRDILDYDLNKLSTILKYLASKMIFNK